MLWAVIRSILACDERNVGFRCDKSLYRMVADFADGDTRCVRGDVLFTR